VIELPDRLANGLETCDRLGAGLSASMARVSALFPMRPEALETLCVQEDDALYAFLKRFELFADAVLRRVLRPALAFAREDVAEMSNLDVLFRLETLGGLSDAEAFSQIIALRNRLTHEYPMPDAERVERINAAHDASGVLLEAYAGLVRFIEQQQRARGDG